MRMVRRTVVFLAAALIMKVAIAQSQAPHVCGSGPGPNEVMAGMQPGGNGIAPTPLCYWKSESTESVAAPQWRTTWGAIVVDMNEPSVGIGTALGMRSERRAKKVALADCEAKGGKGCEVLLAYHNQCAVLIAGIEYTGAHGAPTTDEAARTGLQTCQQTGVQSCQVYWSGCSLPERVR